MTKLILASGSPRRRALLEEMGVEFEVVVAPVSELDGRSSPCLMPAELAQANAKLKAKAVMRRGGWTLGADTVVALGRTMFGKPKSIDEAHEFLRVLSGKTHEVITGCALIDSDGRVELFHEISRVTFRVLTDEVIDRYLKQVAVLDKAGAYALQENGDWLVERVEGSHSNVIGLPVERLTDVFRARGLLKQ